MKYYKAEDIQEIFSDENRPFNWTDTDAEVQEQCDFDFYKSKIESLPTIEISEVDTPQTEDAYAYNEDDWYDKMERSGR